MSIIDYFSKDSHKRALFIFNLIAPVYGLIDKYLSKSFKSAIEVLEKTIDLQNKNILDIGTGTGAWIAQFSSSTSNLTGIDFSKKMITVAQKNNPEIKFLQLNANDLKDINDNTFDIVTSSYVLHGMNKIERRGLLLEMKRVSQKYVVIHDFTGKTTPFIAFLEFLERSDYPYFKDHFTEELDAMFSSVRKIEVEDGAGLYIAQI